MIYVLKNQKKLFLSTKIHNFTPQDFIKSSNIYIKHLQSQLQNYIGVMLSFCVTKNYALVKKFFVFRQCG